MLYDDIDRVTIGPGNGLLPWWHQAITWTSVDLSSIGTVGSCAIQLMAITLEMEMFMEVVRFGSPHNTNWKLDI